jgi:hypothetical protein
MPCCYEKAVAKGFGLRNKLFFLISNFFFSPFLSKMAAFQIMEQIKGPAVLTGLFLLKMKLLSYKGFVI